MPVIVTMAVPVPSGILNLFISCALILLLQGSSETMAHSVLPSTVQEFHACVGSTAYIPWPLNVVSRSGHDSTVITLTFQHRRSERKIPIATFNRHRKLITDGAFRKRLVVSQENSGIFLKHVSLDDAGMFMAQARMSDGDVWTRSTNLIIHLRPIVIDEKLNLSVIHTGKGKNGLGDCITLSCGKLEYVGYPAASFAWMSESEVLSTELARDDSYSTYKVCSPFHGTIFCAVAGYSSACTFDHVVSTTLDLPGPPGNASAVQSGTTTSEYILMIGMPALAIGIPLVVLGLWVLTHLLKSYPQYREHRQTAKDHSRENHQPSANATFVEVNSPPSTSHHNRTPPSPPIEDLTISMSQSVTTPSEKEDMPPVNQVSSSPLPRKEPELIRRPDTPHRPAQESDEEEEEEEDDDDDDEEEDDSDEEPEEHQKEDRPLMDDSITPTML